jgi:Rho termination factor-like protein
MATATQYTKAELEDHTVAELKDIAEDEGIDVPSHATKDEIIKAIMKAQSGGNPGDGEKEGDAEEEESKEPLDKQSDDELRKLAAKKGVGSPNMTHDQLVEALQKVGVAPQLSGPVLVLPLSGVTSDTYGIGKVYKIALADIQSLGAVVQANFQLDAAPPGSITQYVRIKHTQAVAGPSISACTAQVSDGVPNSFGSAFDVFQAVSNAAVSTVQLTTGNVGSFAISTPYYLTLISTGANLGVATAGAISVWIRYTPIA